MLDQTIVNKLIAEDAFCSANFLQKVMTVSGDKDAPILILDKPYQSLSGSVKTSLSLNDLTLFSEEYASLYYEKGITPKDVVAVYVDDGVDYLMQFLAITSLGAIPAFINELLNKDILALFIDSLKVTEIFTTQEKKLTLQESFSESGLVLPPCTVKEQQQSFSGKLPLHYPFTHSETDPILITHSSGTTGIPKGVRTCNVSFTVGLRDRLTPPYPATTRLMNALPHAHSSSITFFMEGIVRGCQIKVQSTKDPVGFAKSIESFQPDNIIAFPYLYVDLCRLDLSVFDLSSVRFWSSTGDAAHEKHIRILTRYGTHEKEDGSLGKGSMHVDAVGSSEVGLGIFNPIRTNESRNINRCVGKPVSMVDIQVLGEYGEKLGANEVGKLAVRAPSLVQGYWNSSNITEKHRVSGYWLTGDLAYKDEEGNFYHIDRISDSIKTADGMLYSLLTEELVMTHFDDIYDCSIYSVTSADGTNEAVIKAELSNDAKVQNGTDGFLAEINAFLRQKDIPQLAAMTLVDHEVIHAPVGVTGKVLKRVLRDEARTEMA